MINADHPAASFSWEQKAFTCIRYIFLQLQEECSHDKKAWISRWIYSSGGINKDVKVKDEVKVDVH